MKLQAKEIGETDRQIKGKTASLSGSYYSLFRFSFGYLENGCASATGHVCGPSVIWPERLQR